MFDGFKCGSSAMRRIGSQISISPTAGPGGAPSRATLAALVALALLLTIFIALIAALGRAKGDKSEHWQATVSVPTRAYR